MNEKEGDFRPNIFPGFRYMHAPEAISWLEQAFGFERHFVVPGPEGSIAHAQLKYGAELVMLGSAPTDPAPDDRMANARRGVYVFVKDIDAHYERARAIGADIVLALYDTEYGSRAYSALDPEGNLWNFGTYQPLDVP